MRVLSYTHPTALSLLYPLDRAPQDLRVGVDLEVVVKGEILPLLGTEPSHRSASRQALPSLTELSVGRL